MKIGDAVIEEDVGVLIGRAFERDPAAPSRQWMRRWEPPRPNPLILIPVASLIGAVLALLGLAAVSTGISRVPAAAVAVEMAATR
jgi:hypothetical protein